VKEDLKRKEQYIIPRIKETIQNQEILFNEITKIKKDGELLPSMFRAEA
jgi:hypothetical protein